MYIATTTTNTTTTTNLRPFSVSLPFFSFTLFVNPISILFQLTIEELRKRLKNRGLNQKGKQKVLVSRLRVAVNAGNEIVENILTVLKWDSVEEAQRKDAIAAQMGVDKDQIVRSFSCLCCVLCVVFCILLSRQK